MSDTPDNINNKPRAAAMPTLYTIGHSSRSSDTFLALLQDFHIRLLVDIRRFPGSAKWPQFSQTNLQELLADQDIGYLHMEALGGRRRPDKNSVNTVWRNASFQGYADYMATPAFLAAVRELEDLARRQVVAIMCAEAVWWRCHRALVSDYLKAAGWQVFHIMGREKATLHPFTAAARLINGRFSYSE